MLKLVRLRILVALAITISSSSAANAGFLSAGSDSYFAAANWTLTTNGGNGSGTITTDAMTLISNQSFGSDKYVRYSITIPANIETLSFSWQWSTNDSWQDWDVPSYKFGSTAIEICTSFDRSCSGTVTNLDLSSLVGQQFIFEQNSSDGFGGSATLVISEVNGVIYRAPAPAPAEASVRATTSLSFSQSLYGSDKLSDTDGQLRKTVDAIDAKYGYLIK